MAVERIVVDGPSLLADWPGLIPGKNRTDAAARQELMTQLIRYQDVTGAAITVVFDASAQELEDGLPGTGIEVWLCPPGQTLAQALQRAVRRLAGRGPVTVVCSPAHQAQVATWPGTTAVLAEAFARRVQATLQAFEREMVQFNRQEESRFRRAS